MNISQFIGNITSKGIYRPNLFQVQGDIGSRNTLGVDNTFMVRASSLPSMEIGEITIPYRGRQLKVPGDRTYGDWEITIIADEDLELYNHFQEWHEEMGAETVANIDARTGRGNILAQGSGYKDWNVSGLDRNGNTKAMYTLVGCWPKTIGSIEVGADTNDALAEFTVTLSYQYFTGGSQNAISGGGLGGFLGGLFG